MNKMKTSPAVNNGLLTIILGIATPGLTVARSLGKHNVPLIILQAKNSIDSFGQKTKYGKKLVIDSLIGDSLLQFISQIKQPYLLFPTTDQQVSWLSNNRENLPVEAQLMFPSSPVIDLLINKKRFFEFCSDNNFPITPYIFIADQDTDKINNIRLAFPLIIKTPEKTYKPGINKAYIIADQDELTALYNHIHRLHDEFIIQELIPGGDDHVYFCLQYISLHDGRLMASFTGRKIRQWKPLCGGTASCEPVYVPELHELTYSLFNKAGFRGIGSMEYKKSARDGKYYLIEPTVCRIDFQEGVAIANGVNIPYIAYQDLIGNTPSPMIIHNSRKAWMHFLHDRLSADYYISKKQLTVSEWLRSLKNVRAFDLLDIDDIQPFFEALRHKLKNRLF